MKIDSKYFADLVVGVTKSQVRPASMRSLFDVQSELSGSASVDYLLQKGSSVSGGWRPVGSENEFDRYSTDLGARSNPVIERLVTVDMTHFDRIRAGESKTLNFEERVADLFSNLELEIDDITFNGRGDVKGLYNNSYYSAGNGSSVASPKKFSASTGEQIANTLLRAVTASKADGLYLGKKTILVNSAIMSILRSKLIGTTSVTTLQYIKNNVEEIGEFKEVFGLTTPIVYEKNPSYLNARFTFPLQRVGDVIEVGGGLTAYYICRYSGLVVKNPKTLVRITGAV